MWNFFQKNWLYKLQDYSKVGLANFESSCFKTFALYKVGSFEFMLGN
jgi:hypothetical protein